MIRLFIIFCVFFGKIYSAELHVLMICDIQDSKIGETVRVDIGTVNNQLASIKQNTGMNLNIIQFTGDDANPGNILKTIEILDVSDDDAILFYFSGHGFCFENKDNLLPYLFFGMTFQGCDFLRFTQLLVDKEPRLLIALSDCCNNFIPEKFAPEIFENRFFGGWLGYTKKSYKRLFLESVGVFVGTGCSQGEHSICTKLHGGYFTYSLCKSLEDVSYFHSNPVWEDVIQLTLEKVFVFSKDRQHPFCLFLPQRPSKGINVVDYLNSD